MSNLPTFYQGQLVIVWLKDHPWHFKKVQIKEIIPGPVRQYCRVENAQQETRIFDDKDLVTLDAIKDNQLGPEGFFVEN